MTDTPTGPEQDVLAAEDARYRAMLDGDATALGTLLHDELTYTHSDASRDGKESLLRRIADGALVYREIEHPVERVALVGDTATVAGKMVASILVNGGPKRLDNRVLSVWVREGGTWRLLAFQPTPIPAAT